MVYQTDGTAGGGVQTGFWYYMGTGGWVLINPTGGAADNLGNHTATQTLNLQGQALTNGRIAVTIPNPTNSSSTLPPFSFVVFKP